MSPPIMTAESRATARRRLAKAFATADIDSADLDARLLVCAAACIDHAGFIRDPDLALTLAQAATLTAFTDRRLAHEPVSRILGRRAFWGLDFAVSPAVLDPRPETEGLVGSILDSIGLRRGEPLALLDLGIGSGAILGALLHEMPAAYGIGVDRSAAACALARRNLAAIGVGARAATFCGDWADALAGRFDVVVSNPPYVARADIATLAADVRHHDPHEALDGGLDGYDAYRAILRGLPALLRPGGVAAFECGTGQGETIAAMLREARLEEPAVYHDLAGHDRIVIVQNRP